MTGLRRWMSKGRPIGHNKDPHSYAAFTSEFLHYEDLQREVVEATRGTAPRTILELGTGTGETSRRLLALHDSASLTGIDINSEMLQLARSVLPVERATLVAAPMERQLPLGPFDLVVSVLAVHHLSAAAKRDLFIAIFDRLAPGARFVLGDIMLSEFGGGRPLGQRIARALRQDRPTDVGRAVVRRLVGRGPREGSDQPDRLDDQIQWMIGAGLVPKVRWEKDDLAVVTADRPV